MRARRQQQKRVSLEHYLKRYPQYAEIIRDVWREHEAELATPPAATGEGPQRVEFVVLKVVGGPHKGEMYPVPAGEAAVIGRSRRAGIRLERDSKISREHVKVEASVSGVRVLDLQSRNGTWVNQESLTTAIVRDGDEVRLGRTRIRVSILSQ